MSGPEPQYLVQWEEALRWLAKAAEDLAAGRLLADGGMRDPAAFHVQQALEKVLKALLMAAAEDLRKTHDLETLAVIANTHWPALIPAPFPLAYLTRWYLTSRYPGIDDVSPTLEEISDALRAIESLIAEVGSYVPAPLRRDGRTDRPMKS
jgi:HEPN domain-containing protein